RPVVAVNGAHVFEAHRLKHLPRPYSTFDALFEVVPGSFDGAADAAGEAIDDAFGDALGFFVGGADADALEIGRESALGFADAHAVVVEDDEQLAAEGAGVVEAFEGHAVDDGGIADQGDDAAIAFFVGIAAGHADGGGN